MLAVAPELHALSWIIMPPTAMLGKTHSSLNATVCTAAAGENLLFSDTLALFESNAMSFTFYYGLIMYANI